MSTPEHPLDPTSARQRLEQARGPEFWRSLEDLAAQPGFDEWLESEFPRQATAWRTSRPATIAAIFSS